MPVSKGWDIFMGLHCFKNTLRKLIFLYLVFPPIAFAATTDGNSSSGGNGDVVVFRDGSVHFVDLLEEEAIAHVSRDALTGREIFEQLYSGEDRFVRQLGTSDPHFFDCAKEKIADHKAQSLAYGRLLEILDTIPVFQVEFPIRFVQDESELNRLNLPVPLASAPSARVPAAFQVPVANYFHNQIWVSARLYSKLPSAHQCAAAVHDALRHLNYAKILKKDLTTPEIEVLTRYLMGRPEIRTSKYPRLSRVLAKVANIRPSAVNQFDLADDYDAKADRIINQMNNCPPTTPLRVMMAYGEEVAGLIRKSEAARTAGLGSLLSDPTVRQITSLQESLGQNAFLFMAGVKDVLTQRLQGNEHWDVLSFEKVSH